MRLTGKTVETIAQVLQWIIKKKKFAYFSPDYVVIGMSMRQYKKVFGLKTSKIQEYQKMIIIDEKNA